MDEDLRGVFLFLFYYGCKEIKGNNTTEYDKAMCPIG